MQKLLIRFFPDQIRWKGLLAEALLFLSAYCVWLIFRSPESGSRYLIGNLAVFAPFVTAVLLIFRMLPKVSAKSVRTWQLVGIALACWSIGSGIRAFYEGILGVPLSNFSAADVFNFLGYPLFLYGIFLYPFENRYAPSRFRFILDATISSGVVAALGWLMMAQPYISSNPGTLVPLIYPIVDLVIIMILINVLLANRKARRALIWWGIGLVAIFVSDYVFSLLAQFGGSRAGGIESIGWVIGGLLILSGKRNSWWLP